MKIKSDFMLGLAFGLFTALILLVGVILWNFTISRSLFPLVPVATDLSNPPQPTLDNLTRRVDKLENDQASNLRDIAWKMDQKLLVFGAISLVIAAAAGFLGIKSYNDLDKAIEQKTNAVLEKELYQLDPTNLPIWLIKYRMGQTEQTEEDKRNIRLIQSRLGLTGLQNVQLIDYPDKKCRQGVTIVTVSNPEEEKKLVKFLGDSVIRPDQEDCPGRFLQARKAAIIIYYTGNGRIASTTLDCYENMVTANMVATVANMVLVVGRGLKNRSE